MGKSPFTFQIIFLAAAEILIKFRHIMHLTCTTVIDKDLWMTGSPEFELKMVCSCVSCYTYIHTYIHTYIDTYICRDAAWQGVINRHKGCTADRIVHATLSDVLGIRQTGWWKRGLLQG